MKTVDIQERITQLKQVSNTIEEEIAIADYEDESIEALASTLELLDNKIEQLEGTVTHQSQA